LVSVKGVRIEEVQLGELNKLIQWAGKSSRKDGTFLLELFRGASLSQG